MTSISIIVPAYNEKAMSVEVREQITRQSNEGFKLSVVVIDGGSRDHAIEVQEKLLGFYAKLIKMPQNGGNGAAVKARLAKASNDFILFQEAYLEYNPAGFQNNIPADQTLRHRSDHGPAYGSAAIYPRAIFMEQCRKQSH